MSIASSRNWKEETGDFLLIEEHTNTDSDLVDKTDWFVVCFRLGNSAASEFYIPTFRNTLFHLHSLHMKME